MLHDPWLLPIIQMSRQLSLPLVMALCGTLGNYVLQHVHSAYQMACLSATLQAMPVLVAMGCSPPTVCDVTCARQALQLEHFEQYAGRVWVVISILWC